MTTTFDKSCKALPLPCDNSDVKFYPDPCDCHRFYRCDNGGYISMDCAEGTYFDHTRNSQSCVRNDDANYVRFGCGGVEPWLRCRDTVSDAFKTDFLKNPCTTGTGDGGGGDGGGDGSSSGSGGGDSGGGSGGSTDTGAIVGGVIGGLLLVAVVVVIAIVYLKKRGKAAVPCSRSNNYHINRNRPEIIHTHQNDGESIYDVIDEKEMASTRAKMQPPDYRFANPGHKAEYSHENAAFESEVPGGYSLAKEMPQDSLSVPDDGTRDDLSRTVSIDGREIPIQDHEGYQIAYPGGSMPRLPQHSVDEASVQDKPHDYFQLEKDP